MTLSPSSMSSSTRIALSVLQRLLDSEAATLLQLSYVVENLYDPVHDACNLPQEGANPQKTRGAAAAQCFPSVKVPAAVLARARAIVLNSSTAVERATAAAAAAATTASTSSKSVLPVAAAAGAVAPPVKPTCRILTHTQFWEMFSNINTLYLAHSALVTSLENAIAQLLALLEKQEQKEALGSGLRLMSGEDISPIEFVGEPSTFNGAPSSALLERGPSASARAASVDSPPLPPTAVTSPAMTDESTQKESQQPQHQHSASATHFPPAPPRREGSNFAAAAREVLAGGSEAGDTFLRTGRSQYNQQQQQQQQVLEGHHELAAIILNFLNGPEVAAFSAQHMMYTFNFTMKIAPKILELARLWRWTNGIGVASITTASTMVWAGPGAATSSSASVPTAIVASNLRPRDRETEVQYAKFLKFLFKSFGKSGVPLDERVREVNLPEDDDNCSHGNTSLSNTDIAKPASTTPSNYAATAEKARASHKDPTTTSSIAAAAAAAASSLGTNNVGLSKGVSSATSSIPKSWCGFRTLLLLLATPLSTMRRCLHAARCLIESGALLKSCAKKLQGGFVKTTAEHLTEETNLVMDGLTQWDVTNIINLMDDPPSSAEVLTAEEERRRRLLRNGDNTRFLVHYGRLQKRYRRGRHDRLMFLFSDLLCYVEELNTGRLRVRGIIPFGLIRVIEIADAAAADVINCFEIVISPTERYTLFADTPEQKRQWVEAIRFAVKRYTSRQRKQKAVEAAAAERKKLRSTSGGTMTTAAAAMSGQHHQQQQFAQQYKVTARPLPRASRLARQQRYDHQWQDFLEYQRSINDVAVVAAVPLIPATTTTVLSEHQTRVQSSYSPGGPGPLGTPQGTTQHAQGHLSATSRANSIVAEQLSRNGSFGNVLAATMGRSSTHRQLEYDVGSWALHRSGHWRIRSQDLAGVGGSSIATPTATPRDHVGSEDQQHHTHEKREEEEAGEAAEGRHGVHSGDTTPPAVALGGSALNSKRLPPELFLSISTCSDGRSATPLAQPLSLPSSSQQQQRSSQITTPLRRPVSELFENAPVASPLAVAQTSSKTQLASSTHKRPPALPLGASRSSISGTALSVSAPAGTLTATAEAAAVAVSGEEGSGGGARRSSAHQASSSELPKQEQSPRSSVRSAGATGERDDDAGEKMHGSGGNKPAEGEHEEDQAYQHSSTNNEGGSAAHSRSSTSSSPSFSQPFLPYDGIVPSIRDFKEEEEEEERLKWHDGDDEQVSSGAGRDALGTSQGGGGGEDGDGTGTFGLVEEEGGSVGAITAFGWQPTREATNLLESSFLDYDLARKTVAAAVATAAGGGQTGTATTAVAPSSIGSGAADAGVESRRHVDPNSNVLGSSLIKADGFVRAFETEDDDEDAVRRANLIDAINEEAEEDFTCTEVQQ